MRDGIIDMCIHLAMCDGFKEEHDVYHYVDLFGCDLRIYYHKNERIKPPLEELRVWFGGMEVCRYSGSTNAIPEKCIDGIWMDLVIASYYYYTRNPSDDFLGENNTLIEMCRAEARKNRETIKKVTDCCLSILHNKDCERKEYKDSLLYSYDTSVKDTTLLIESEQHYGEYDALSVCFNKKCVFSYRYNSLDSNIYYQDKCSLFVLGRWIQDLQRIAEKTSH